MSEPASAQDKVEDQTHSEASVSEPATGDAASTSAKAAAESETGAPVAQSPTAPTPSSSAPASATHDSSFAHAALKKVRLGLSELDNECPGNVKLTTNRSSSWSYWASSQVFQALNAIQEAQTELQGLDSGQDFADHALHVRHFR